MKILKLTDTDNKVILINLDNVTHITPGDDDGSVIYTIKDSGYYVIRVKENMDKIMELAENK